jgi:hypothetical protein
MPQLLWFAGFLLLLVCLDRAEGINVPNFRASMDIPSQPRTCNKNAAKTMTQQSMLEAPGKGSLQNEVAASSQESFSPVAFMSAA